MVMMRRLKAFYFVLLTFVFQFLSGQAWAGGEGLEVPEPLGHKVSLEGLSGIPLFLAETYNDNLLLYAILCTVLMAVVGMAIALITDVGLKLLGLDIGKIEHRE